MENEITQILLNLAQQNAEHIDVLNREMGGVLAEVAIIKWFISVNVVVLLGITWGQFKTHKEIKKNNGK